MVDWQIEAERQSERDWRMQKKTKRIFEWENGADKFRKEMVARQEENCEEKKREAPKR